MTTYLALTSEQVRKAVDTLQKSKAVYVEILDFYGRVFDAQENCKGRIELEPLQLSEELRTARRRENLPLIEIGQFIYDEKESANLFLALCHIATEANPNLSAAAGVILDAVGTTIKPEELFEGLLKGNEALFENIVDELEIEKPVLGFLTYNSLKPSISGCADQLSVYLDRSEEQWLQGYCPVCGSAPILSLLEDEGKRKLVCSFCWHLWPAKRVQCPYCDGSQNKDLHYFYSEEEKDTRVDLCDKCQKYIKTIDTRKADRLIYPPLEHISTMHLDINAQEKGFEPGIRLFMEE